MRNQMNYKISTHLCVKKKKNTTFPSFFNKYKKKKLKRNVCIR